MVWLVVAPTRPYTINSIPPRNSSRHDDSTAVARVNPSCVGRAYTINTWHAENDAQSTIYIIASTVYGVLPSFPDTQGPFVGFLNTKVSR